MAQSERFQLSLRVLAVLAEDPSAMKTSAEIAETLNESAVMVRRAFLLLHKGGLLEQRKGPNGGARLKLPPKQIGLGDIDFSLVPEVDPGVLTCAVCIGSALWRTRRRNWLLAVRKSNGFRYCPIESD